MAAKVTSTSYDTLILGGIPRRSRPMSCDEDPMAVVDPRGRVRGVANLHVIDASILPTVPAANTQLPTLAVTETLVPGLR
jgi:choline dehydrogenase-like flavoprotein